MGDVSVLGLQAVRTLHTMGTIEASLLPLLDLDFDLPVSKLVRVSNHTARPAGCVR